METYKCIHSRISIREYTQKTIPKKTLLKLVKAASAAPSGLNVQPWYFLIIRNQKTIKQMRNIVCDTAELTMKYPEFVKKYKSFFNAPCLITACLNMNKRWYHLNNPSKIKNTEEVFCNPDFFSIAAAIQNILLAAHSMDIGTCWAGPEEAYVEKFERLLNIRRPYRLVANITVGYYKKIPPKPPRKPIKEIYSFID